VGNIGSGDGLEDIVENPVCFLDHLLDVCSVDVNDLLEKRAHNDELKEGGVNANEIGDDPADVPPDLHVG